MAGFFSKSELAAMAKKEEPSRPRCGTCGLAGFDPRDRHHDPVRNGILLIGSSNTSRNRPGIIFNKEVRKIVRGIFDDHGIEFAKCGRANAISCYSQNDAITPDRVEACRPVLFRIIKQEKPTIIVPFGGEALLGILGSTYRPSPGGIAEWSGYTIPDQRLNAWICPVLYPPLPEIKNGQAIWGTISRQLARVCALARQKRRPWVTRPDFKKAVTCEMSPSSAAKWIREIPEQVPIAFDYETTGLKPDRKEHRIVCCSVRAGSETLAFPWGGAVINAMSDLLKSRRPKIAANLKFEERWTKAKLGHRVRNWAWDTMQAQHLIDNRRGVCGVKFLAYALLGEPDYEEHVSSYLKAKFSNDINKIKQVDMRDLLLYCGLDSHLEYEIATRQMETIGYEFRHSRCVPINSRRGDCSRPSRSERNSRRR